MSVMICSFVAVDSLNRTSTLTDEAHAQKDIPREEKSS
jgi:hypothetical protein